MRPSFHILLVLAALACSESKFQCSKKDGGKDKPESAAPSAAPSADAADQPVQITGTYLRCQQTAKDEQHAAFGCDLVDRQTGRPVPPPRVARAQVGRAPAAGQRGPGRRAGAR